MKKGFRHKDYFAVILIFFLSILIFWMIKSYSSYGFIYQLIQNNPEALGQSIQGFGTFSKIIFILLIVFECIFAPIPPLVLYIAGGNLFGWFIAGILALVGNIVGAGLAFQLSHHYGKEKILPKIPESQKKNFHHLTQRYGPISIFFLRLNPITSSDIFSYIAGFTKMNFGKFLLGTTLGLLPTVFLQTYLGEQIQGIPWLRDLSIILGALYVLAFFILYFWIRKKK